MVGGVETGRGRGLRLIGIAVGGERRESLSGFGIKAGTDGAGSTGNTRPSEGGVWTEWNGPETNSLAGPEEELSGRFEFIQ